MTTALFPSEDRYGPRLFMYLSHCSSEEADHPANALRFHTRNSVGWQSDKGCIYPQELGFSFEGEVDLQYIRILAHESKIASRIEVFVASITEEEVKTGLLKPYESSTFQRLGYVHLSTNVGNKFGARELKTINIRRRCVYVKLLLSRPHRSDYNVFNQVGIIALASHGVFVRSFDVNRKKTLCLVGENVEVPFEEMIPPGVKDWQAAHQECEGGPDIDAITARRIAEFVAMKERAVAAEDYDLAAALKSCLVSLESTGKEIYKLEKQKAAAVKEEDYTVAKKLKQQIDSLREEAYKIPKTLSNTNSEVALPSGANEEVAKPVHTLTQEPTSSEHKDKQRAPAAVATPTRSAMFDETPVGGCGFYELENAPNPTMSGEQESMSVGRGGSSDPSAVFDGKPKWEQTINRVVVRFSGEQPLAPPLSGEALSEAKITEQMLGTYCCACLFGKKGQLREAAIRAIISPEGFTALSSHTHNVIEALLSYMSLPFRGFGDAVAGVVLACCEVLNAIVKGEIQDAPPASALMPQLNPLLPELVMRSGDSNSRIREMVESVLMSLSDVALDAVVSVLLVDHGKAKKRPTPPKTQVARMNLLSALVDRYGINGTISMNLETDSILSKAVIPCLQHPIGEVREAASQLFAKLLLLAPKRAAVHMEALKPAQQNLVEQHMEAMRETALRGNSRGGVEINAAHLVDPTPALRRTASAGRSSRQAALGKDEDDATRTCQFCGEFDAGFTEAALDIHYIRMCPMLCPCPLCDQVTEIATLQQHLTSECENRLLVRECPICKEAVRVEDIKRHVAANACIKASQTHSVCPLCHARFQSGAVGWVAHLASPPGCPNNPRRYDGSGPIVE
ncbi:hypothetical protein DQ04_05681010 [Trypanosoma grayi]|uniref:hypothetical protein n=1 Tax=Trypanosoma grayi TaxID=71804 RepID=UPI0004F40F83|nr:hypothetical protein DQ04_05681010 [Trypanosoma grayi]KEG09173.1 hypothetical protein DQ04_05681010 [Trypanosoma grayi]